MLSVKVWVPKARLIDVGIELNALTEYCGGVTVYDAVGKWIDRDGMVVEGVLVHEWFAGSADIIKLVIWALLRSGEEAVAYGVGEHRYVTRTDDIQGLD